MYFTKEEKERMIKQLIYLRKCKSVLIYPLGLDEDTICYAIELLAKDIKESSVSFKMDEDDGK